MENERNKLGMVSLCFISLGLKEGTPCAAHVSLFEDGAVLSPLMILIQDKYQLSKQAKTSRTLSNLVKQSDTIANEVTSNSIQKRRIYALQILVNVCGFLTPLKGSFCTFSHLDL